MTRILTLLAAIAAGVLALVPTGAQPQASTTTTDFEIGRETEFPDTASFYAEASLAQVAADVAAYCASLAGAPPVVADLQAYLDATHDRVWQVSLGKVKYKYILDPDSGNPIPICTYVPNLYVMDPGYSEPVVIACATTTTFP